MTLRSAAFLLALLLAPSASPATDPVVTADSVAALRADDSIPDGRWRRYRTHRFDADLDPAQRAQIERLEALGYLSGSHTAAAVSGVTRYDESRVTPGRNLLVSGHAPEALLLDMDGNVLHRWAIDFASVWPDYPLPPGYVHQVHYWRRAYAQPNGDLLAIFEGLGLVKLDRDSRVLWAQPDHAHHALEVRPDGEILVLTREAHVVPRFNRVKPVLEDFVTRLAADGTEMERTSLLEAFERSPMRILLEAAGITSGDVFHTNAIDVLPDASGPRPGGFAAGNVLVSMRELSTLAVVDLEKDQVVWAHQADYVRQHDPTILPDGHILLFDNGEVRSRVLEFDPLTGGIVWAYEGTETEPFFSATCGTAQRLEDGNTLITESDNGRAFEVTPDGDIVWEYVSPYRAGAQGELVATLFEMRRLPADYGDGWLDARE